MALMHSQVPWPLPILKTLGVIFGASEALPKPTVLRNECHQATAPQQPPYALRVGHVGSNPGGFGDGKTIHFVEKFS